MIKKLIAKIAKGQDLEFKESCSLFEDIFNSKLTPAQIAAILVGLKVKGETEVEIAGAVTVIRKKAKKIDTSNKFLGIKSSKDSIIDTCGTGGSGLNKFNVSTATAFVVSASGVKVAKHGNKAMSSNCGSADVLEELGIKISSSLSTMEKSLRDIDIAFLYAPLYHPALGSVATIRRELGIRTIFNILGPLCNPALANHQLLGVHSPELVLTLAKVLRKIGVSKAMVVNGKDVCDEISLTGKTKVALVKGKSISFQELKPSDFGLKKICLDDILVSSGRQSAKIIKSILAGKKGAPRDMVLANASACLYILSKVRTLKDGVKMAGQLIDDGKAYNKYKQFKDFLENNA